MLLFGAANAAPITGTISLNLFWSPLTALTCLENSRFQEKM